MDWDYQLTGGGDVGPSTTGMNIPHPHGCMVECQNEPACMFWTWNGGK